MEMTFRHVCDPCEYLLFDNVCTPEELDKCLLETQIISSAFKDPKDTGSAKDKDGVIKKKNKGVFLHDIYNPYFSTFSPNAIVIDRVFNAAKSNNYTALSYMQYLKSLSGYNVLLSAYKNGDYYLNHRDSSVLTLIFWFGEDSIVGGDFLFTAFNHTIPFKKNSAIIFPSHYDHQVTEVKTDLTDYVRFSTSAFLTIVGNMDAPQPTTVGTNDF